MHIIISADFNLETGQYNRSVPSPPPASASQLKLKSPSGFSETD